MDDGKVIDAAERFVELNSKTGEQAPDIDGQIIYLDEYCNKRNEIIEAVVEQTSAAIVVVLESNGHKKEAEQVLRLAYQFAREGIPASEIYYSLIEYFEEVCPNLYRIYQIMNR